MTLTPQNAGWIEVICGSMFSGKTEELIRRLRRAQIAKMTVAIFKPKMETRYSSEHIVSHNQLKMPSFLIENPHDIVAAAEKSEVIGIDEAQFFDTSIISVCKELAAQKKRVIVAGLDTDYLGQPFGPMPELMCEADYLDKFRAICIQCGNPASYTQRTSHDTSRIVLGELDVYEARCRDCHELPGDAS